MIYERTSKRKQSMNLEMIKHISFIPYSMHQNHISEIFSRGIAYFHELGPETNLEVCEYIIIRNIKTTGLE